jgi:uncharacterized membrane protein YfcA
MLSHVLPVASLLAYCVAIFAGSFTNGLVGLAFAGVSGGILFLVLPPASAVAVLAVGGFMLQLCNNIHYFAKVDWRKIAIYAIPGLVGIPVGSWLLRILPHVIISLVFGLVLLVYVAVMSGRKPAKENNFGGRPGEVTLGFIGGLLSGMIALPGIPVVIWSNIRGYGKEKQRALSVPYNFLMLLATVAITGIKGDFRDPVTQAQLCVAIPVALIGWSVGVRCFGRISEAGFRRFVMLMLFLSGLALIVPSAKSLTASSQLHASSQPVAMHTA